MINVTGLKTGQKPSSRVGKMEFEVEVETSICGLFFKKSKWLKCNCFVFGECVGQLYCIDSGKWLVEHIGRDETNKIEHNLEKYVK